MLNKYTHYDPDTGEIIMAFTGTNEDAELNTPYIEGEYDPKTYIIVDGVAVEKSGTPFEETDEYFLNLLRQQRDMLLQQSDWTQVPDAPVDQAAWATYRQALRDLPANTTDPRNPVWPSQPT